jgi:multidrug transporter EmrE-like cation transporter
MTAFGWVLVVLLGLTWFNKEANTTTRAVAMFLIGGILFWGTGTGV